MRVFAPIGHILLLERQIVQPKYCSDQSPVGVAGHRVPPLILIDVDTLDVCLCVNVVRAAGQSLEEASSVAPRVDPGCMVVADAPHDPDTVALDSPQVTSDLTPEPEKSRWTCEAATEDLIQSAHRV